MPVSVDTIGDHVEDAHDDALVDERVLLGRHHVVDETRHAQHGRHAKGRLTAGGVRGLATTHLSSWCACSTGLALAWTCTSSRDSLSV